MIHNKKLIENGYLLTDFNLPKNLKKLVDQGEWVQIDKIIHKLLSKNGQLYKFLKEFGEFSDTEYIISIRDANDPDQDDGIWHDDGSRNFAFSLSLTVDAHRIDGGQLSFKQKNKKEITNILTPEYSSLIIFLTGIHGYEHKINRVTRGKRIIIAGWLS